MDATLAINLVQLSAISLISKPQTIGVGESDIPFPHAIIANTKLPAPHPPCPNAKSLF